MAEDIRHTPKYKKLYEKRKETIEYVFADAKEKYSMHYTLYRGLAQVTNWFKLIMCCHESEKICNKEVK